MDESADLPVCGYCGKRDANPLQAEHVVPRCLWDGHRPGHMITVPSCGPCNQGYGADEEYFRTALVAMAGADAHPQVEALLDGKVKRSLGRSRRLREELTRGFGFRPRFTGSGLFAGWGWSFELDLPRFQRAIEKTVRGLFFHKSQRPLAADYAVHVYPGSDFWQAPGFQAVQADMDGWAGVGDDVFGCRSTRGAEDPDVTAWLFVYYRTLGVFAWTAKAAG